MKARKVPGLDPDGSLADNLRLTIETRLHELDSFVPRALDPRESKTQHDMRIAAKRLRYALDMSRPVFGEPAKRGAKVAKHLQQVLGEVHDDDELLVRARAYGGLEALLAHLAAHRAVTFESFVRDWPALRDELSATVRALAAPVAGGDA